MNKRKLYAFYVILFVAAIYLLQLNYLSSLNVQAQGLVDSNGSRRPSSESADKKESSIKLIKTEVVDLKKKSFEERHLKIEENLVCNQRYIMATLANFGQLLGQLRPQVPQNKQPEMPLWAQPVTPFLPSYGLSPYSFMGSSLGMMNPMMGMGMMNPMMGMGMMNPMMGMGMMNPMMGMGMMGGMGSMMSNPYSLGGTFTRNQGGFSPLGGFAF